MSAFPIGKPLKRERKHGMHKGQLVGRKPNGAKGKPWRESCDMEDADGKRHATLGDCVMLLVVGAVCIGVILNLPNIFPEDPKVTEILQRIEARNLGGGMVEVVEETMQDEDESSHPATAVPTNEPPKSVTPPARYDGGASIDAIARNGNSWKGRKHKTLIRRWNRMTQKEFETALLNYRVDIVSETLWQEARGEGEWGIRAVASVISNRAKSANRTLEDTCLRKSQFSCWNNRARPSMFASRPWIAKSGLTTLEKSRWNLCRTIAYEMATGAFKPTITSTHYYAHNKVKPSWAAKLRKRQVIGNHTFGVV